MKRYLTSFIREKQIKTDLPYFNHYLDWQDPDISWLLCGLGCEKMSMLFSWWECKTICRDDNLAIATKFQMSNFGTEFLLLEIQPTSILYNKESKKLPII